MNLSDHFQFDRYITTLKDSHSPNNINRIVVSEIVARGRGCKLHTFCISFAALFAQTIGVYL